MKLSQQTPQLARARYLRVRTKYSTKRSCYIIAHRDPKGETKRAKAATNLLLPSILVDATARVSDTSGQMRQW